MKAEKGADRIATLSKVYFKRCIDTQSSMPLIRDSAGRLQRASMPAQKRLEILKKVCQEEGVDYEFMRTLLRADQIRDYNELRNSD